MLGAVGLIFWEMPYQDGGGLGAEHAGGLMTNTASLLLPRYLLWHCLAAVPAGSARESELLTSKLGEEPDCLIFSVSFHLKFFIGGVRLALLEHILRARHCARNLTYS